MDKRRDFHTYTLRFIESLKESVKTSPALKQKPGIDKKRPDKDLREITNTEGAKYKQEKCISLITNIKAKSFPSVNTLNSNEIAALCREVTDLLNTYNFCVVLPDDLPAKQKYNLLRQIWNEPLEYPTGRTIYLEFCDCDPECCPFPLECCQCNNFNGFDDFYDDTTIVF